MQREKLRLGADGWLENCRRVPSPNCDQRPSDGAIDLIVVHAISLPPGCFGGGDVEALFTNSLDPATDPFYPQICELKVSAHFLIRRDGELVQFVPTHLRAWHAGASEWRGRPRCNDFSLGIELEGCDECRFEACQYDRLASLVDTLREHYPIEAIAGHCEIAPGRKTDPGPYFEWDRVMGRIARPLARC